MSYQGELSELGTVTRGGINKISTIGLSTHLTHSTHSRNPSVSCTASLSGRFRPPIWLSSALAAIRRLEEA